MKSWHYQLTASLQHQDPALQDITFSNRWINIYQGQLTIHKGYAWNGINPKYYVNALSKPKHGDAGDADKSDSIRPSIYHACLLYDVLSQFHREMGLSRSQVIALIQPLLDHLNWPLRHLCLWAIQHLNAHFFNTK